MADIQSEDIKNHARYLTRRAIEAGQLIRQPCERCGSDAEAHHEDYSNPFAVRWLCRLHHRQEHKRLRRLHPELPSGTATEFWSPKEYAAVHGICLTTVWRRIWTGKIVAEQPFGPGTPGRRGGRWFIRKEPAIMRSTA